MLRAEHVVALKHWQNLASRKAFVTWKDWALTRVGAAVSADPAVRAIVM